MWKWFYACRLNRKWLWLPKTQFLGTLIPSFLLLSFLSRFMPPILALACIYIPEIGIVLPRKSVYLRWGRIPSGLNNVVSCLDTMKDPKGGMMDGWIY